MLHRVVGPLSERARRDEADDRRVFDPGERAHLAPEALVGDRVVGHRLGQQLDGDPPPGGDLPRQVHLAHAALAEQLEQLVGRGARRARGESGRSRDELGETWIVVAIEGLAGHVVEVHGPLAAAPHPVEQPDLSGVEELVPADEHQRLEPHLPAVSDERAPLEACATEQGRVGRQRAGGVQHPSGEVRVEALLTPGAVTDHLVAPAHTECECAQHAVCGPTAHVSGQHLPGDRILCPCLGGSQRCPTELGPQGMVGRQLQVPQEPHPVADRGAGERSEALSLLLGRIGPHPGEHAGGSCDLEQHLDGEPGTVVPLGGGRSLFGSLKEAGDGIHDWRVPIIASMPRYQPVSHLPCWSGSRRYFVDEMAVEGR